MTSNFMLIFDRTEVMKERHATAKRLRKYYLECLKELLENDKEAVVKNENPMSDAEKMHIMQDRLQIPENGEGFYYFLLILHLLGPK